METEARLSFYGATQMSATKTDDRQKALELIASLQQEEDWAAHEMARYFKLYNDWRAEWTRLHELRLQWSEKIRPRPPIFPLPVMAAPINLSIVEDKDADQKLVEHGGVSGEHSLGIVTGENRDALGESFAA